jgi:hypothetical protein
MFLQHVTCGNAEIATFRKKLPPKEANDVAQHWRIVECTDATSWADWGVGASD